MNDTHYQTVLISHESAYVTNDLYVKILSAILVGSDNYKLYNQVTMYCITK